MVKEDHERLLYVSQIAAYAFVIGVSVLLIVAVYPPGHAVRFTKFDMVSASLSGFNSFSPSSVAVWNISFSLRNPTKFNFTYIEMESLVLYQDKILSNVSFAHFVHDVTEWKQKTMSVYFGVAETRMDMDMDGVSLVGERNISLSLSGLMRYTTASPSSSCIQWMVKFKCEDATILFSASSKSGSRASSLLGGPRKCHILAGPNSDQCSKKQQDEGGAANLAKIAQDSFHCQSWCSVKQRYPFVVQEETHVPCCCP